MRHGADPESWLRFVAHSKFAVLPITKESLNPSGISTALSIMALGKALVVTDVNKDGKPDIITVNDQTISVVLHK